MKRSLWVSLGGRDKTVCKRENGVSGLALQQLQAFQQKTEFQYKPASGKQLRIRCNYEETLINSSVACMQYVSHNCITRNTHIHSMHTPKIIMKSKLRLWFINTHSCYAQFIRECYMFWNDFPWCHQSLIHLTLSLQPLTTPINLSLYILIHSKIWTKMGRKFIYEHCH